MLLDELGVVLPHELDERGPGFLGRIGQLTPHGREISKEVLRPSPGDPVDVRQLVTQDRSDEPRVADEREIGVDVHLALQVEGICARAPVRSLALAGRASRDDDRARRALRGLGIRSWRRSNPRLDHENRMRGIGRLPRAKFGPCRSAPPIRALPPLLRAEIPRASPFAGSSELVVIRSTARAPTQSA